MNAATATRRGLDHLNAGQHRHAEKLFRKVTTVLPLDASAQHLLGLSYYQQDQVEKALPYFERAARLDAKPWQYHQNLGLAYQRLGRLEEARERFSQAVDRVPQNAECWHNLGTINLELDDLDQADRALKTAIRWQPDYARAYFNRGCIALTLGEIRQAVTHFSAALNRAPDFAEAYANLIHCRDFLPETTPGAALIERRAFQTRYAAPLKASWRPHENDRDPDRPLRVGYLGGDFKDHSAAMSFGPILAAHDPSQVHVGIYANQEGGDRETRWMRDAAVVWRDVHGWTDEAVAEQIREDRIDVLVELSGFTNRHRLLAVARKPAPVIVTAWGYLTGTGLDAVDAIFADDVTVPPEHERYYSERVIRLPHALGFSPPGFEAPIKPRREGPITFGHLGRLQKISDATIALWASILQALPESHLLLKDAGFSYQRAQDRIAAAFAGHGIDPARIEMRGKSKRPDHLATYNEIDIALDPIPQGGGITTLEALWMATPVVTVLGDRIPGRTSASTLIRLGHTDVPTTQDEYRAWALALARNIRTMDVGCLREQVKASVICNPDALARAAEVAYRELFSRWASATPSGPVITGGLTGPL